MTDGEAEIVKRLCEACAAEYGQPVDYPGPRLLRRRNAGRRAASNVQGGAATEAGADR